MYRFLVVSLLALAGSVIALNDVDQQCVAENTEAFSNDNLVGTWYKIWKFTLFGGMVPSPSCPELRFSKPTADIIQQYKNKHNAANLPYNLDDNPVLVEDGYFLDGMVTGNTKAKFFVLSPNTTMILYKGYEVDAYRPLSPKYIMYTECKLRGNTRWLLSNDRYAPVDEVQQLIKNTAELNNLGAERYCA